MLSPYLAYIPSMNKAALAAGKMLREEQLGTEAIDQNYKDFVTRQDIKSEEMILAMLREALPHIPAYSEEAGGQFNQSGLLWVIDPIDGTFNYYRGNQKWGISIALLENGITIAGVVYIPAEAKLFYATIDTPTAMEIASSPSITNPRVSEKTRLERCNFILDYGKPGLANPPEDPFWTVWDRLRAAGVHGQISVSSSCHFMQITEGEIDAFIGQPDPFDTAASGLILKQAGGRVTDFKGNDWKSYSPRTLASNGKIHDQLLKIINP